MRTILRIAAAAAVLVSGGAAAAQEAEIGYPAGSLGYQALMKGDYATAEKQILSGRVEKYDPARALNLGLVLARTGRTEQAAEQFRRVLAYEDVELILADGATVSSHAAARTALDSLRRTVASR